MLCFLISGLVLLLALLAAAALAGPMRPCAHDASRRLDVDADEPSAEAR